MELRDLAAREAIQLELGMEPDLFTDLKRSVVAPRRPAEELYDILADPHETAGAPEHAADLQRLRSALREWQAEHGDLGLLPEADLMEQWRPNGKRRLTEEPQVAWNADDGASIGWTSDFPANDVPPRSSLEEVTGAPEHDGRRWKLYHGPVKVPAGTEVCVCAWRLGFEPSPEVAARISRDNAKNVTRP